MATARAKEATGVACRAGEIMTSEGCATLPRPVHEVTPDYPPAARREGVTGQVTLEASVTPGGTVEDIAVLHATATDAAHLESMRQAAREAFARWRYTPAMVGTRPVRQRLTATFYFDPSREQTDPPHAAAPPEPPAQPPASTPGCCISSSAGVDTIYDEFAKDFEAVHGDVKAIVAKLSRLADAGHAEAQYYLGMHYNNGIGVTRDPRQAYVWFSKAAASGDPLGAYKVGCYLDGQFGVVLPDRDKAHEYKLIAARAGYDLAQREVADHLYAAGKTQEALKWLKAAADQGNPPALFLLAGAYDTWPGARDPVLAYTHMRLAKVAMGDRFSPGMESLLDRLAGKLSAGDPAKAERLVSQWQARPTPLTSKARFGWDAEERFLRAAGD